MSRKTFMTPEPKVIKKLATTVYSSFAMLTGMQLGVHNSTMRCRDFNNQRKVESEIKKEMMR